MHHRAGSSSSPLSPHGSIGAGRRSARRYCRPAVRPFHPGSSAPRSDAVRRPEVQRSESSALPPRGPFAPIPLSAHHRDEDPKIRRSSHRRCCVSPPRPSDLLLQKTLASPPMRRFHCWPMHLRSNAITPELEMNRHSREEGLHRKRRKSWHRSGEVTPLRHPRKPNRWPASAPPHLAWRSKGPVPAHR